MKKKIFISLTIVCLIVILLSVTNSDTDSQWTDEETELLKGYSYEIDEVKTIIRFRHKDETYKTNIMDSNKEVIFLMKRNFDIKNNYTITYKYYQDRSLMATGNIKNTNEEIIVESVLNGNKKRKEKPYGIEGIGEVKNGQLKLFKQENYDKRDESKSLEELNKKIFSTVLKTTAAIKGDENYNTIKVNEDFFVKEITLDANYSVKSFTLSNLNQLDGEKYEIKVNTEAKGEMEDVNRNL